MPKIDTTQVDAIVGRNIRLHRVAAGMSQQQLGRKVGVSFQQIQKYEKGINRLGAGRLMQIAQIFGVQIAVLFDGATVVPKTQRSSIGFGALMTDPWAFRLAQAFADISDTTVRRCIIRLVEQITHHSD